MCVVSVFCRRNMDIFRERGCLMLRARGGLCQCVLVPGSIGTLSPSSPSLPLFPSTSHSPSLSGTHRVKGGWQKSYTSLDNFQLKFYSDHKIAMDTGTKPLGTFHLLQATVCIYAKEKKTKHTFMVSLSLSLPLSPSCAVVVLMTRVKLHCMCCVYPE